MLFGSQKFLQLGANLVLTRYLFPEAFGLMAIVSVFLIGLNMFSDLGLQAAVVQNKNGDEPRFLSTAWTLQIIRGFALTFSAICLAWPVALVYEEPTLFYLIVIVSGTALIKGFSSIGIAHTQREIKLKSLSYVEFGTQLCVVGLTIALTIYYKNVWALAFGNLIGTLVRIPLSFWLLPSSSNKILLDRVYVREILSFGKWIFAGTLLTYLGGRGIAIIQGKLVGMEILGFITIASTLAWALGDLVSQLLKKVTFPYLSAVNRTNPNDFAKAFSRLKLIAFCLILPGFFCLSFISEILIDFLYDDRYSIAGKYLAILAIGSSVACVSMIYQNGILARGNAKVHFNLMSINAVARISLLVLGYIYYGVWGMLIGMGLASLVSYFSSVAFSVYYGLSKLQTDILVLIPIGLSVWLTYTINFS